MQKKGRMVLVSLLVMLALVGFTGAVSPNQQVTNGTTSGHNVPAILGNGNIVSCAQAGCSGITLPIEKDLINGETYSGRYYIDATHYIDIDAQAVMGSELENSINWKSNFDVVCVVLKGANGYDAYYCTKGHTLDDTSMSTPINNSNKPAAISHILICYNPPVNVPEFPAWFMSLLGIAGLVGMLVAFQRK